jgi:uncharacterized protein
MRKPVTFFSEGVRLAGDLYLPDELPRAEKRAGIVLCHGYTGVRNIYLPVPSQFCGSHWDIQIAP